MLISIKNINQRLEVDLPLSKSESNRALMILHYGKTQRHKDAKTQRVENSVTLRLCDSATLLSNSDDTVLLQHLLNELQNIQNQSSEIIELNCNNAGTVLRFLMTAVANLQLTMYNEQCTIDNEYSSQHLRFLLTGSDRMKSRPISSLVDALRSLGVSIEYVEKEGFPPVLVEMAKVKSQKSKVKSLEISVEQSSQFASSLLLAAPLWKNGLELHLTGNLSSLPYIDMTIDMMKQCGIDVERKDRVVAVKPGTYNIENIKVEPDWSAAAFWYEMVAFSDDSEIMLKNLNINSLQADAAAVKMFKLLGVETIAAENGILLRKTQSHRDAESQRHRVSGQQTTDIVNNSTLYTLHQLSPFNFQDCPDLFPAVIATCAGLQINAAFTGLRNLSIKESDRKQAMMNELKKIGVSFENISDDEMKMFCHQELPCFTEKNPMVFDNYEDHRIAMALSILSIKIGAVSMEKPEVVSKSYPKFWEECFITLT